MDETLPKKKKHHQKILLSPNFKRRRDTNTRTVTYFTWITEWWWCGVLRPFQDYFSYIETMKGRYWKVLCNEAPYSRELNSCLWRYSNPGPRERWPITKTPIQIYWKFYNPKMKIFRQKFWSFHISAQNIDCRYSLEPPQRGGSNEYLQFMHFSKIRKIMYTPVNPSFTIIKVGFKRVKIIQACFRDESATGRFMDNRRLTISYLLWAKSQGFTGQFIAEIVQVIVSCFIRQSTYDPKYMSNHSKTVTEVDV